MFSDPEALAFVVGALIVAVLVTCVATRFAGRRIALRSLLLARVASALVAPALTLAYGIVQFRIDVAAHPRADLPPMALAGTIAISMLMLLATIPTAWVMLRRQKA